MFLSESQSESCNFDTYSTLFWVKVNFHTHFRVKFYHSKICCHPFHSFSTFTRFDFSYENVHPWFRIFFFNWWDKIKPIISVPLLTVNLQGFRPLRVEDTKASPSPHSKYWILRGLFGFSTLVFNTTSTKVESCSNKHRVLWKTTRTLRWRP